jgi:hypothetical protein
MLSKSEIAFLMDKQAFKVTQDKSIKLPTDKFSRLPLEKFVEENTLNYPNDPFSKPTSAQSKLIEGFGNRTDKSVEGTKKAAYSTMAKAGVLPRDSVKDFRDPNFRARIAADMGEEAAIGALNKVREEVTPYMDKAKDMLSMTSLGKYAIPISLVLGLLLARFMGAKGVGGYALGGALGAAAGAAVGSKGFSDSAWGRWLANKTGLTTGAMGDKLDTKVSEVKNRFITPKATDGQ